MGKQGPCYHCGVTSTPLWRNGPPEKPVLCNACGSRWRTKGTLTNYTPLHARPEGDESDDHRVSKLKIISLKREDGNMKKRKLIYENAVVKREAFDYIQEFPRITDEDTSNRSSSGSAVSLSECSAQFSSADASDLTGPAQSIVWEAQVPSKKRTCVNRIKTSSPVEKLIKDLHAVLHEQQSSCLSGSSEEDLIFENEEPMVSVEIGHGSVLIKHPSSLVREEESEASSLSVENKSCALNEAYSRHVSVSGYNQLKGSNGYSENFKKLADGMIQQKPTKRDTSNCGLLSPNKSPLCYIDLSDVVNFEVLMGHLTNKEQQQLLKYLPPPDTFQLPGSLQSMFDSSCFKENLSSFQQLLSEGVFSNTHTGVKAEDLKTLKKLALSNATKSKWTELYYKIKDSRFNHQSGDALVTSGSKLGLSKDLGRAKKLLQEQNQNMPDIHTSKGSKRGAPMSDIAGKETLESDGGSLFAPRDLFGLPTEGRSMMPDDSSDQEDLLLDVPSNAFFPQAELLYPISSFGSRQASANSISYTHPAMINH